MTDEILNTEITDSDVTRMATCIESLPYTTTALTAMSMWLRANGDETGANMILAFALEFARHEATTL